MADPRATVRPVTDRHGVADFLRAPHEVHAGDPNWIAPLTLERRLHFSARNPFFQHARARYFVAYRGQAPVGRVSAQIDDLAQPDGAAEPVIGHFGCLEAVDRATLAALMHEAEGWLGDHGITRVLGPFSLSINDETGLLVEGFDRPARMLMNYAPPWYAEALDGLGYRKAMDTLAYDVDATAPLPAAAERMAAHAAQAPDLRERPMDPVRLRGELEAVVDIYNDAWSDNWGFVPMTKAEAASMADTLKPLIRPELIRFVERDGEPIAMVLALPDLHEAIADLNGKLLPFGWARMITRLKAKRVRGARVLLMGVRPAHRRSFMGGAVAALLIKRLHDAAPAEGIRTVELSWVLEDNQPTRGLIETLGGTVSKRYRVFEKALAS